MKAFISEPTAEWNPSLTISYMVLRIPGKNQLSKFKGALEMS